MDLGVKSTPGPVAVSEKDKEAKVTYPEFSLRDKVATKFIEENDCDVDEEYSATITFRVSSLRKDEYGDGVGLSILSIDDVKESEGGEDEGDEADKEEEKVLGFKRPKSTKEAPDTGAATLED